MMLALDVLSLSTVIVLIFCAALSKDPSDINDAYSYSSGSSLDYISKQSLAYKDSGRAEPPLAHLFNGAAEPRHDFKDLPALMQAGKISNVLRDMGNYELGILAMQEIYDGLPFETVISDASASVGAIQQSIDEKLLKYQTTLNKTSIAVDRLHAKSPADMHIFRHYKQCCMLENDHTYSTSFQAKVNLSMTCDIVPSDVSPFSFYPGANLTSVFFKNREECPNLKWQYFVSSDGLQVEYPARNLDPANHTNCLLLQNFIYKSAYISTTLPYTKNVAIIIDHGYSMSAALQTITNSVAMSILHSLSHRDRITVIAASETVSSALDRNCEGRQLAYATQETKYFLERYLYSLPRGSGKTNHSSAFVRAFEQLRTALNGEGYFFIFYISRGLMSSLDEAGSVLATIASENLKSKNSVRIKTFAIVENDKRPMLETKFLDDVATQNLLQFKESLDASFVKKWSDSPIRPPKGKMYVINGAEQQHLSLPVLFESFSVSSSGSQGFVPVLPWGVFQFSEPQWDRTSKGMIVSMTRPAYNANSRLIGIVGADLHLLDLTEPVTYYGAKDAGSYAAMIDIYGNILVHPKLTRPLFLTKEPLEVDISQQEDVLVQNSTLRKEILSLRSGIRNVSYINRTFNGSQTVTYHWKRLKNAPYIVFIASRRTKAQLRATGDLRAVSAKALAHLTYHRLDLSPRERADSLCVSLKKLATTSYSTLFLSARTFQEPFRFLTEDETRLMSQGIITYISDDTRLISNPGLKPELREEVIAIGHIAEKWKERLQVSPYANNILRRYIATPSGAMLVYPGTLVDKSYDPITRDWYLRALLHSNNIVFTAPYLDPSGAGYIVTMSHTVYEGKDKAMHHPTDQVVAVMALDMPIGFLYDLLVKTVPACLELNQKCFLFDDRGYLVAHPPQALGDARQDAPIEQHHMTRKESFIMSDLLSNPAYSSFVQKILCNRYSDGTVQRSYVFNTSFTNVTRSKKGEQCVKYQIVHVQQTNLFLGIVNQTCTGMTFVPCSVNDRRCLNCHKAEPVECECPCECPLHLDICSRNPVEPVERYPTCDRPEEPVRQPVIDLSFLGDLRLPSCFNIHCSDYSTAESCDAVVGCSWCTKDSDQETPLPHPYCEQITMCFGGVKGQSSFFDRNIRSTLLPEGLVASTPVGPVAGGIMAVFVLLVVGVYFYRHKMGQLLENARNGPLSAGGNSDSGSRLHPGEDADDECHFDDAHSNNIILASFERENINAINPFRLNNYRRGPATTSDHGYSTMAQSKEDSEQSTTVDSVITSDNKVPTLSKARPGQRYASAYANPETTKLLMVVTSPPSSSGHDTDADSTCESVAASATSLKWSRPFRPKANDNLKDNKQKPKGATVLPKDIQEKDPHYSPSVIQTVLPADVHSCQKPATAGPAVDNCDDSMISSTETDNTVIVTTAQVHVVDAH